jgi:hypothetical protein
MVIGSITPPSLMQANPSAENRPIAAGSCRHSLTTPCIGRGLEKRDQEKGTIVITLDDLEYSYPDDGDQCHYCGRKWASDSPWEFFYLDNNLLCKECAPKYRRASSRERKQE